MQLPSFASIVAMTVLATIGDIRRFSTAKKLVEHDPSWKARYAWLEQRLGSNKATVMGARKLLVVVWHMLHEQEADCQANAVRVAAKLMAYSYDLTEEQRGA